MSALSRADRLALLVPIVVAILLSAIVIAVAMVLSATCTIEVVR